MKVEKITADILRAIEAGEKKLFQLPDASACASGRSYAYQLQRLLGCKFSVRTNFDTCTLTISRQ